MSCTGLSTILIYVLPFVLIAIIFMATLGRKLPYPPGPKGYPVIGNMAISNRLTHRGLAQLSEQYGGLCHLKMGMLHMVVVSTPEMAKEVLQAQDKAFSNRPATLAIRYLTYDRADMAFAHYGAFWRQMRKMCVVKLFSRKRAESWASVREEVDALVHTIETKDGTPINISALVFGMAKNITYRAAFGSTLSYEGQDEFVKIMQEFSKLFGAFHIADFFPNMGFVFGQDFNRRLEKARSSLDSFIDKIIDDHIAKRKNKKDVLKKEADDDMVDELLEFYNEDGGAANFIDESQSSFKINRDNIKALIMDVMFGGTETVASAIEWAMAELMHSPEDLKKVQQELFHVVGSNRQVQESDLEKLTYLHCVVKETLRLHPPIPLLLHETAKDCVVAGYKVPAKARVMINVWAINRDKTAWDDAHTFKPSRFLTNGAPDFKGSDFEFLPFGSGRRSCPGMQLGLYSLNLIVAKLCHGFTWELPDGMKTSELDMDDVFGLTAPRAIQLVLVPRNRLRVGLVGM